MQPLKRRKSPRFSSVSHVEYELFFSVLQFLFSHHWVKSVRIQNFADSYFPAFELNTERDGLFSPNAGKYKD